MGAWRRVRLLELVRCGWFQQSRSNAVLVREQRAEDLLAVRGRKKPRRALEVGGDIPGLRSGRIERDLGFQRSNRQTVF
jgi:hypothetical protein